MAITWAEVGVFKGTPALNGNVTLTRLGTKDVSATYNALGVKKISFTGLTINYGDEIWLVFGSQATTPYQLRASAADDVTVGLMQSIAGRPSTVASPTAWAIVASTLAPPVVAAAYTGVTDNYINGDERSLMVSPAGVLGAVGNTVLVTNTSYAVYLGRSPVIATGIDVLVKVTTAAA